MECPNCNKNYDDEFRFCPFCGEAQPEPKICPKCEFETYDEYIFCPRCGTELIEKYEAYDKIKFFNKQIELDPSNYFFWSGKACFLFESGRYEEAIEC